MEKIIIKNKMAIDKMRVAGNTLARLMHEIESMVQPGISTYELDDFFEKRMLQEGLMPVCKGYAGYKHATLISVNDVVVHGIPSKEIILKSGDFVKIDVVGAYKSYCADMARGFFVDEVSDTVKRLATTAQRALDAAISKIAPGVKLFDISYSIQQIVEHEGFGIVRDFAGHGIGKAIHEGPTIPNYGQAGRGIPLQVGMTLAIEPMITEKSYKIRIMPDGWTAKTIDGGLAAHVEDTIVVTATGAEVLTRLSGQ